ncbi:hypothetical protein L0B53_16115 [Vibrio sp. SS-MA-C1-2]|uniref:hypothetical protein n=1 Tax=Vibrio sp. SS-MA-C1-2 TaxID=2908646 RepID=UPI001F381912|nr:hypothetical protein [Vibrio sp. SS-MA-C1-2]UJF18525.1 hypothetical protein L0B53_16115 [Vibrio sp. SS-MA-C1-2]
MQQLNFPIHMYSSIKSMCKSTPRDEKNMFISFIISEDKIYMIGGQSDNLFMFTLEKEADLPFLGEGFSIEATAFRSWLEQQDTTTLNNQFLTLNILENHLEVGFQLQGTTKFESIRFFKNLPLCEKHVHFFKNYNQSPRYKIKRSTLNEIIKIAAQHPSFDVIEITKENKINILVGKSIHSEDHPSDLELETNLMLTPNIINHIQAALQQNRQDDLDIYCNDEQLVYSNSEMTFTLSSAEVRIYKELKKTSGKKVSTLILSNSVLRDEIAALLKMGEVKKEGYIFLYVSEGNVCLLSSTVSTGSAIALPIVEIKTAKEGLYCISLNQLSNIPIQKITGKNNIKLTILEKNQNDYYLAFYHYKKPEHPHRLVPVESVPHLIPEVRPLIESTIQQPKNRFGEQVDMFGLDDV